MAATLKITRELTQAAAVEACLRAGGDASDTETIRRIIDSSRFSQRITVPWCVGTTMDEYAKAGYRISSIA